MKSRCPKCDSKMTEGKIPIPHKYLFGFKSNDQKYPSLESNIQKALLVQILSNWIFINLLLANHHSNRDGHFYGDDPK